MRHVVLTCCPQCGSGSHCSLQGLQYPFFSLEEKTIMKAALQSSWLVFVSTSQSVVLLFTAVKLSHNVSAWNCRLKQRLPQDKRF